MTMSKRNIAVAVMVLAGLALAACTRSANTTNPLPPTATTGFESPSNIGPETQQDPTMAALGTAIRMTQTAQAVSGGGGGGEIGTPALTPGPGTSIATATPIFTATVPVATPTPTPVSCPNPYTVKPGEWLYQIARNCKVDPSTIIAANPGINPNFLVPGQKLNMPGAGATPVPGATPGVSCTGTHTVVRGENLFRIAFNCGLTTEQLAAVNGIPYPYIIYPGQVLKFP